MIWVALSLIVWLAAWRVNVALSHSGLVRHRAGRLVVPALFGLTILVVWEGLVRGLAVPGVILPPPSAILARIAAEVEAHVWPMIAAGKFRPVMDSEFPLEQAAQAHARMESSGHVGKIVLKVE